MMSCAQVRPILSFLIEKETGPLETLEARRHLDTCDSCRARADRLSVLMTACGNLPSRTPPSDFASSVMQRLRSMKAAATGAGARGLSPAAAKWSGLVALIGAGLALVARPAVPALKALGAPLVMLAGMLGDPGTPAGATDVAGRVVAVALQYAGVALKPEWASGAGIDGAVTFQLLATAMTIAFLLAIPAGILTAWFLHEGAARHRFPHL